MTVRHILPVEPRLPSGVRVFAIVFLWLAGTFALWTIEELPRLARQGAIIIPSIFQAITLFFLLVYLAVGYLKGECWSWWFSYTNAVLALLLVPIFILTLNPAVHSVWLFLVMIGYWAIALLTYLGLRTADVRTYFGVGDIHLPRFCVMLVLLTSLQSAWWFTPEVLMEMYLKLKNLS